MITVNRKNDVSLEFTFKDVDGNVINITNGTVYFTVKKKLSDPDNEAVIAREITEFATPIEGKALLTLTDTETDIEARSYFYDVVLELGITRTSSERGRFNVIQGVKNA